MKLNVHFVSSGSSKEFEVDATQTLHAFKEMLGSVANAPTERLAVVIKGSWRHNDEDTLEAIGVTEEDNINVVIRTAPPTCEHKGCSGHHH